ncbi:MAG: alpha/beta hydrolase [Anaerolineae bacterium]|nr:alpha/beta hydrolase [Anaerolineae bacterium]
MNATVGETGFLGSQGTRFLVDLGGHGPFLHLAHANGFPPGAYEPLADALRTDYHLIGLAARPLWPDSQPESTSTWQPMAGDLIEALDGLAHSSAILPIFGVGHSLGGVLTLWAAIRRPDLFRAVVLIDPVILPPSRLCALRLMRLVGLHRRLPVVQAALHRRRTWPSRQACIEHLASKPFFAGWPAGSLDAYVNSGTRQQPDGQVELIYPPKWEAHIFATVPTDIWRYVPQLRTPVLVIRGERSPTFPAESMARLAHLLPLAQTLTIPGSGHMVPLERPAETAKAIRHFARALVLRLDNAQQRQ